jgi:hypothetical protein
MIRERPGTRIPEEFDEHGKFVMLYGKDRKFHKHYVADLVLEAFIGPCPEGMEAKFKDGNRMNAVLDNLYWGPKGDSQ